MTEPFRLTPTAELGLDALATVFNEAYEGYEVPLHVDAGVLAFMHEAFDIVPERSCLAWEQDRPVGLVFLGVRGTRGWVGGMGVCPAARRRGLGERLMRQVIEHARTAGVRTLGLEVLENNVGAKTLYEKLGFRTIRRLEVLAWDGAPAMVSVPVEASDPKTARRRILATRRLPEPWQRGDETLDRLDVSTPALRAVSSAVGDAVYRVTDGRASILQMEARDEDAAGALLDTIRAKPDVTLVRFLNVPAEHPAAKALHHRGATRLASQLEMSMELGSG